MSIRQEYFELVVPFEQCEAQLLSIRNYVEYLHKALLVSYRADLKEALVDVNKLYDVYGKMKKIVEKAYDQESGYSTTDRDQCRVLFKEFEALHERTQSQLIALDDRDKMNQDYLRGADKYYEEFYRKNTMPEEMAKILKSRADAGEVVTINEINELARIYIN